MTSQELYQREQEQKLRFDNARRSDAQLFKYNVSQRQDEEADVEAPVTPRYGLFDQDDDGGEDEEEYQDDFTGGSDEEPSMMKKFILNLLTSGLYGLWKKF